MMQKKTIAGIEVSIIALGAGGLGPAPEDARYFAIMDEYVRRGGNFFDTARMYADGECDRALGRWMRSRSCRDDVVVCAKGCYPASRVTTENIRRDLEDSLDAMGVDFADFYLLHRDDVRLPVSEIVCALDGLVREGKARAVGCSNWTVARIHEANQFARENGLHELQLVQMHHSLALTTPAATGDLTHVTMNDVEATWYRGTNFPVMSFGAQGRGYFARHLAGMPQKPGGTLYYDRIPENRARAERLRLLSEQTGYSPAAICAAYVRDCGLNTVVLNAFSSVEQLADVFGALEFALTPAQVEYLQTGRGN